MTFPTFSTVTDWSTYTADAPVTDAPPGSDDWADILTADHSPYTRLKVNTITQLVLDYNASDSFPFPTWYTNTGRMLWVRDGPAYSDQEAWFNCDRTHIGEYLVGVRFGGTDETDMSGYELSWTMLTQDWQLRRRDPGGTIVVLDGGTTAFPTDGGVIYYLGLEAYGTTVTAHAAPPDMTWTELTSVDDATYPTGLPMLGLRDFRTLVYSFAAGGERVLPPGTGVVVAAQLVD